MQRETLSEQISNPYLRVYREVGLSVVKDVTAEDAELISAHIALLHNTMGIVIKDMIRMLSMQFKQATQILPPISQAKLSIIKPADQPLKLAPRQISKFLSQPKKCLTVSKAPPTNHNSDISEQTDDIESSSKKPTKLKQTQPIKQPSKRNLGEQAQQEEKKRVSCNKCEKFYQAAGIECNQLCQCSSRHKKSRPSAKVSSFSQYFDL